MTVTRIGNSTERMMMVIKNATNSVNCAEMLLTQ